MKEQILKLVKHALFVPILCLTLISILVLFAGPFIAIAGYVPLATWPLRIVICVLLFATFFLIKYIQHLKSLAVQDALVDELVENNSAQASIAAEENALQEKFKKAFASSKNLKKRLTDIPWFMIIGAPGSGKTTLLANSGLEFPLADASKDGIASLRGVGGTKNCDWWIGENAVLLDTAGRYTTQDSYREVDENAWHKFLKLLKKYRKRPLSGLIVSLDMTDLLSSNEYELNQKIKQLQQRVSELNNFYNTRFPVYLVITKSDMLAGFSQFFESFSHAEREQVLGITFTEEASINATVQSEFASKYSDLCNSLSRRKWARMSVERDDSKKSLLYLFTEQLSSLQSVLHRVVSQLASVQSNDQNSLDTGLLRGLYFTSGTQTGAPIDRMAARVSQVLGLQINRQAAWHNDQRSYFIKDVLEKIMMVEADVLGTLSRFEKRMKAIKLSLSATCCIATLALSTALFVSYQNNRDFLLNAQNSVDEWRERHADVGNTQTLSNRTNFISDLSNATLPALNDLLGLKNVLMSYEQEHFSSLGLNQASSIDEAIDAAHLRIALRQILPFAKQQMEAMLVDESDLARQYQSLKTYLMMGDDSYRDNRFITDVFQTQFTQFLLSKAVLDEQQVEQLSRHLQLLVTSNMGLESLNESLINEARKSLRALPLSEIYYQQLKSQYTGADASYFSMSQLAGTHWRSVFSVSVDEIDTVPHFFSPEFLKSDFDQVLNKHIDNSLDESWVLGQDSLVDRETMQTEITAKYIDDYIDTWQNLLDSASIKTSTSISAMNNDLRRLAQSNSAIFSLLSAVSEATSFPSLQELASKGTLSQLPDFTSDSPKRQIHSRFKTLHELMQDEQKSVIQQNFISLIQDVSVAISFASQNQQAMPNSPAMSAQIQALNTFGFIQPEPLKRWTNELSTELNKAQDLLIKSQLNTMWTNQILPQCSAIVASKYPFNKQSSTDASLADLQQLFAQTGSILRFFNEHLAQYVYQQTRPWRWKEGVQSRFQYAPQVLSFFERVASVQSSIFAKSPSQAGMDFSVTPIFLDSRLSRMDMSIYGSSVDYQFGRSVPTSVSWPPANTTNRSDIRFVQRDGSELREYKDGIFAFARLLENANIRQINPTKMEVSFKIDEYESIFEINTTAPSEPALFNRLSSFKCLSTL